MESGRSAGLVFSMLRLSYLALFVLCGCASVPSGRAEGHKLPYACNDLVVVGRQAQVSEVPVASDDLLGVSRRVVRIDIKRVVKGAEPRETVLAEGISHGRPREDLDFLLVLEPRSDGTYSKRAGAVWEVSRRPGLIEPCSVNARNGWKADAPRQPAQTRLLVS